jgi:hypothetical protein
MYLCNKINLKEALVFSLAMQDLVENPEEVLEDLETSIEKDIRHLANKIVTLDDVLVDNLMTILTHNNKDYQKLLINSLL